MSQRQAVTNFIEASRKPSRPLRKILIVLLSKDRPMHGYELALRSKVRKSTVYVNLDRLLKWEFIEAVESDEKHGRYRVDYQLTPLGKEYTRQVLQYTKIRYTNTGDITVSTLVGY